MIDKKYKILAVNPVTGGIHTEEDSILFLAKDRALLPTLKEYLMESMEIGCDAAHVEAIEGLIKRVEDHQLRGSEVADLTEDEIEHIRRIV